jgi:hypothetical protein
MTNVLLRVCALASTPAKVELTRDGKALTLSYAPSGEPRPGLVWVRRKEIPAERCRP